MISDKDLGTRFCREYACPETIGMGSNDNECMACNIAYLLSYIVAICS